MGLPRMVLILSVILLCTTASRLSSFSLTMELAFLTSLLSLLVSPVLIPQTSRTSAVYCTCRRTWTSKERKVCTVLSESRYCPYSQFYSLCAFPGTCIFFLSLYVNSGGGFLLFRSPTLAPWSCRCWRWFSLHHNPSVLLLLTDATHDGGITVGYIE